jgi:hypothetical protein
MTNIAFWKSAHPYLYIEKQGDDYSEHIRLTESEIKDMLAYIKQNLNEIWVEAIEEDISESEKSCGCLRGLHP